MEDYRLKPEHRKGGGSNYRSMPKFDDNTEPLKDPRDNEVKTHIYHQPDTWGLTSTKRKFTGIMAMRADEFTTASISPDGTPCITTLPEPKPKVDKWEWYYEYDRNRYTLRMGNGEEFVFTEEYLTRMGRYIQIALMPERPARFVDYSSPIEPVRIKYIEVENPIFTRRQYDSPYSSRPFARTMRDEEEMKREYEEILKKYFRDNNRGSWA